MRCQNLRQLGCTESFVMTHSIGDAANGVVRLTSNTIALVYADPSKAVYWTKPSDWEADLDNPWDGLKRDNAQSVIVGLADGFVQPIDVSMPPEKLRAMLTRDGGETIKP